MLNLIPVPHVLRMKETISTNRRTNNCGGQMLMGMYITAMAAIATSAMAENHIRTNSIGLQLQAEFWYAQQELPQA